jgi:hypothetical protein
MRRLCTALIVVVLSSIIGCGTIIYPERRGQAAGPLDAGIVVLDAVGLLFFFVPGVVAFAVDFATGAIYLPKGQDRSKLLDFQAPNGSSGSNRRSELQLDEIPLEQRTLAGVEEALRVHRGIEVDLRADARVRRVESHAELPALFAQFERELAGEPVAAR